MSTDLFTTEMINISERVVSDFSKYITSITIDTTSSIDHLRLKVYGADTTLSKIAIISKNNNSIKITPFDKELLKIIYVAVKESNTGSCVEHQDSIIINIPQVSMDTYKNLLKEISKKAEESKVAMRLKRQSLIKKIKENESSKNIIAQMEKNIQKIIDNSVKEVDNLVEKFKKKYNLK